MFNWKKTLQQKSNFPKGLGHLKNILQLLWPSGLNICSAWGLKGFLAPLTFSPSKLFDCYSARSLVYKLFFSLNFIILKFQSRSGFFKDLKSWSYFWHVCFHFYPTSRELLMYIVMHQWPLSLLKRLCFVLSSLRDQPWTLQFLKICLSFTINLKINFPS
jgi:hypothetical protein